MQTQSIFVSLLFLIWLLGISLFLYRIFLFFNKLTKDVGVADIKKTLEKVIAKEQDNTLKISELKKRIAWLEENGKAHVQKLGFVRFNPFKELGGDHSFSLAILNDNNSGVIITSLHTRDRTRVYMKDIRKGKSFLELSHEEKKALDSAQRG